ncbi:PREDICTED: UDP-glycosyltransferase 88A1-like [Populus euphratica]|uniref:Glycosyltransferase n=1 Tax=Populus euphratica TaxID=75702 RepID=A0AAJ6T3M2_POPEU|nr:PREDICTED: UDP-glycosyltransferase 88A1-like [Populus euphratica]
MEDTVVLYPSQGHLSSMLELGKLILKHRPSVSVTFVMPNPSTELVSANPSITFIPLPEVSLPTPITSFLDLVASFFEIPKLNNPDLHQTLSSLSASSNIKALIIDFFCSPAFEFLSSRLDIPIYYFNSSGACGLSMFLYMPTLDKNTTESLKDLDILVEVPGVPKVPSKDIPPVLCDRSHRVYQYFVDTGKQMFKSAGVVVNTFESLEPNACKAIQERKCIPNGHLPPIFCVGPLAITGESRKENECLTWLDSQPSRSVLYLCFGSMGVFSSSQLKEMAIGLEKSGVRFLWAVRAPREDGQAQARKTAIATEPCLVSIFPEGFLDRTKDRGFIVKSWAPQLAILNHGSVGGFVTHCGWKSILEAVCAGVPMLGWPLYAEQKMNSVFLVEEMKVGLAVKMADEDDFVSAAELEERVTDLMNSKKGEAVRERVKALREAAVVAKSEGGSTYVAMERLLESFK